ncbi:MAG: hypothetical protein LBS90_08295 [Oscillospiraceae bacterium]|jgi:hypothetical protein|nr:hypothetical protein [Oscillospiraceae bacterium]
MQALKLIMGVKGSGKTKQFIELVNHALKDEKGNIICVERGGHLTYDLPHDVRLIESTDYDFPGYDFLKGFITGLRSGNYDVTHIFFDSVLKIIGREYGPEAEAFFDWVNDFGATHGLRFTMMVTSDAALAGESVKKYF